MEAQQNISLSIVIPAFNEASGIAENINRIKAAVLATNLTPAEWEIIVCDNNSSDDTANLAENAGAKVVFERINQISRARNTGAKAASGKYLLFIDADTYPCEKLMNDVLFIIREGNHVGCGTTVKVEGGSAFNRLRMERLNPLFRLFKVGGGAFLLCQKEAFEAIEGFSTGLYAYEEFDFIARLKRYGRKNGLKFSILYKHPVSTSGRKGELTFSGIGTLILSSFTAPVLLLIHRFLPEKVNRYLGKHFLGYWYRKKR